MRYQVPQFIEVEDRIFGPLTLKQFLYLAGGGGLCLLFFTLLPLYVAVLFMLPVAAFAFALAFYKVNGRPFIVAVEHALGYYFGNKLYLWKQRQVQQNTPAQQTTSTATAMPGLVPKISQSKLKDLAWSLNIKDQTAAGVVEPPHPGFEI